MGFLYKFKDSEKVVFLEDCDVPKAENHQDGVQQVSDVQWATQTGETGFTCIVATPQNKKVR